MTAGQVESAFTGRPRWKPREAAGEAKRLTTTPGRSSPSVKLPSSLERGHGASAWLVPSALPNEPKSHSRAIARSPARRLVVAERVTVARRIDPGRTRAARERRKGRREPRGASAAAATTAHGRLTAG